MVVTLPAPFGPSSAAIHQVRVKVDAVDGVHAAEVLHVRRSMALGSNSTARLEY